jgi:beta-1,4-mannosyl-glycoprotein beta-1,4-N-acetylglucosaminyltransferase
MIIDCFPFFNELDILDLRLNILSPFVDKFILVEASKTQSKLDKPFYFEQNKHRYDKFLNKIIHIKIEDYPNDGGWAMENFQRNCINIGLEKLSLQDDAIIAISDVDEIWNPKKLTEINNGLNQNKFCAAQMEYFVFYLNLNTVNKGWIGTVFFKPAAYLRYTPQDIRNIKDHVFTIQNCGWHFGYQGGADMVHKKYLSCIEPINKNLLPSKEVFFSEFNKRIIDGGSFIFSDNLSDDSIKLQKINIFSHLDFPEHIIQNKILYQHMLL